MTTNLPKPAPSSDANADTQSNVSTETGLARQLRNLLLVLVAIALSTSVFFGLRTETGSASLEALAETSMPLEVALSNGKPTLTEFYANWCTACQAMAKDMGELKETYGDRINFVMLNVDNSKWLPEMLHYRVDGIPHFLFINSQGEAIASAIGEQPHTVMAANLDALASDASLPYSQSNGQFSKVEAPVAPKAAKDDPRSHGG